MNQVAYWERIEKDESKKGTIIQENREGKNNPFQKGQEDAQQQFRIPLLGTIRSCGKKKIMSGRRPTTPGPEEPENVASRRHSEASDRAPRQGSDKSAEALETMLTSSTDRADARQTAHKPPTTRVTPADSADGQTSLRHNFSHLHSSSTSRTPSTRTSSSSLQALNEDTVVDARSDHSAGRSPRSRRTSHHLGLDLSSNDYPVYPDQSYAVLQSQIHPTYRPPQLWTRSSYPSHADPRTRFFSSRASRTAGNSPTSSPGLFSFRSTRPNSLAASDDEGRISSPYLHPTHLQPPKE